MNKNADCFVQDERQYSLLEYAVIMSSSRLCQSLLERQMDLNIENALIMSAMLGKCEILRMLLDNGGSTEVRSEDGSGLLHLAVMSGNRDMVQCCLGQGLNPNTVNNLVCFWLIRSLCLLSNSITYCRIPVPSADCFRLAGRRSAPERRRQTRCLFWFNMTPLHCACIRGDIDVVRALVAAGAKVNAVDRMRRSSLHYAVIGGSAGIYDFLIRSGGHRDIPDELGETPHMLYQLKF